MRTETDRLVRDHTKTMFSFYIGKKKNADADDRVRVYV